jgi:hypothetical protein
MLGRRLVLERLQDRKEENDDGQDMDIDEEAANGSPAPPQPANDFDEAQVQRAMQESLVHRRGPTRIKGG